jgi:phospholipid-translocating ATPase
MLDGLYQSAVVFFIPYLAWILGLAVSWNGLGIDSLADFGTTIAVSASQPLCGHEHTSVSPRLVPS